MRKILVVQSRITDERIEKEQRDYRRVIGEMAEVAFLSALDERLAWSDPGEFLKDADGVIFGGSSDFDFHGGRHEKDPIRIISMLLLSRTRIIVIHAIEQHIPVLGICFGHQLIANMHGGHVQNDVAQGKVGSHEVCLTGEGKHDRLFGALPERFIAQYYHKDSVTKLPAGATLLASAENCRFSALRYGTTAYTMQFHPEVEAFADLDIEAKESPEASHLIPLWIERVVGGESN